jgi:hypothetical protein
MKHNRLIILIMLGILMNACVAYAGGVAPEQIFQHKLSVEQLVGVWELLPDENPLEDRRDASPRSRIRTMMALRKDGTCRVFSAQHPAGLDGTWSLDDHRMSVTLTNAKKIHHYVYGVRGDFMVTRTPVKAGRDELWARVH